MFFEALPPQPEPTEILANAVYLQDSQPLGEHLRNLKNSAFGLLQEDGPYTAEFNPTDPYIQEFLLVGGGDQLSGDEALDTVLDTPEGEQIPSNIGGLDHRVEGDSGIVSFTIPYDGGGTSHQSLISTAKWTDFQETVSAGVDWNKAVFAEATIQAGGEFESSINVVDQNEVKAVENLQVILSKACINANGQLLQGSTEVLTTATSEDMMFNPNIGSSGMVTLCPGGTSIAVATLVEELQSTTEQNPNYIESQPRLNINSFEDAKLLFCTLGILFISIRIAVWKKKKNEAKNMKTTLKYIKEMQKQSEEDDRILKKLNDPTRRR